MDEDTKQLLNEIENDIYNFYDSINETLKKHKLSIKNRQTMENLINVFLLAIISEC